MAGINKVIIVGHLSNDPEIRTMPNGDAVANISVATSESWTDKNTGEKKTQTEWHRIIFFRRQAEVVSQYLSKGSQVYVEGKLKTRKWQDQNGQDRYVTEIYGDVLQMVGSKSNNLPPQGQPTNSKPQPQRCDPLSAMAEAQDNGAFNDDIPF